MRAPLVAALALAFCSGCFATHDPPVLPATDVSPPPLPLVVRVNAVGTPIGVETGLCARVVSDLRSTRIFATVNDCDDSEATFDVIARASWRALEFPEWCSGGLSLILSVYSAGVIPGCDCIPGYDLQFARKGSAEVIDVDLDREECVWTGWGALFLNLRDDYHWYGPHDAGLRGEALRQQLLKAEPGLATLAPGPTSP